MATNQFGGVYFPGACYDQLLRIRILQDLISLQPNHGAKSELARKYSVSPAYISKLNNLFVEYLTDPSGEKARNLLFSRSHSHIRESRKLDIESILYILLLVEQNPTIYLWELQLMLYAHLNIEVSMETIRKTMIEIGLTHKKVSRVHLRRFTPRNIQWRRVYSELISQANVDRLFYFDECGFARRDTQRNYGWSASRRCVAIDDWTRLPAIQLLALMGKNGVQAIQLLSGTVTSLHICNYFLVHVFPFLPQGSVIVMDNASIHRGATSQFLADLLQLKDSVLIFLPPYSPDLNPIENMFGTLKCFIKDQRCTTNEDLLDSIFRGIDLITPEHCTSWFVHCGIVTPQ